MDADGSNEATDKRTGMTEVDLSGRTTEQNRLRAEHQRLGRNKDYKNFRAGSDSSGQFELWVMNADGSVNIR
jgi:hypothetical protein